MKGDAQHEQQTSPYLTLYAPGIALALLIWTIDKFVNVEHALTVYEKLYFILGLGESIMMGIAVAELLLIGLFVVGRLQNITYLAVLLIHIVSTITPIAN